MAIQKEFWLPTIEEQLYAGNEWIKRAKNDSAHVTNKTVHIPQAGAAPVVTVDRDHSTDETSALRTDTIKSYTMREYTTKPTKIPNIEEVQTSYSKRASVLEGHTDAVNETIALYTLKDWGAGLGAADIVRTTGADTGILVPGAAAGTRKKATLSDFARIRTSFAQQNLPTSNGNIICVMPPEILADLFTDEQLANIYANANGKNVLENPGMLVRYMGFDIYERGRVILTDGFSGAGVREPDEVAVADSCAAAFFFHKSEVRRAKGAAVPFFNAGDAKAYGDIMSLSVIAGASNNRSTAIGIKVLAQDGAA